MDCSLGKSTTNDESCAPMKPICTLLLLPLVVSCVSIDLPGVVTDSAKVAKDTYQSVARKKDEQQPKPQANTDVSESVVNTYIGQESQTTIEVKNLCVSEAVAKLFRANGKEVPYTVTQNTLSTVNSTLAATCVVKADKLVQPSPNKGK